ncbi:MAG: PP2C family protein-serine/threonine phosphatase [Huintestinicola sp.]|uniref:PP2C family protein-serine/threonine phosphatase n=1 Tax=Huintestinicola sp. TaxID=2981661 RepID=UPI003EFE84B2
MIYCCGGLSDIGNFRENNEDSIFFAQKVIGGVSVCFAAVCDGIGGMKDGEIASRMISEALAAWFDSITDYSGDFSSLSNSLLQKIYKINTAIIEKTQVEDIQTGSTIAAVLAADSDYFALNVGDSRIYRISGTVSQISKDDVVFVNVNENTVRTKLSQCIGNGTNIYVNTVSDKVKTGDAFVICSDGLYKLITESRLRSSARWIKNEKACVKNAAAMISYVKKKGEKDNISAVIIKCVGSGSPVCRQAK